MSPEVRRGRNVRVGIYVALAEMGSGNIFLRHGGRVDDASDRRWNRDSPRDSSRQRESNQDDGATDQAVGARGKLARNLSRRTSKIIAGKINNRNGE